MKGEGYSMRYVSISIALSSLALSFLMAHAVADDQVNRSPSSISRPELSNAIAQAGSSPVASSGAFLPSEARPAPVSSWLVSYRPMQAMQTTQTMSDPNADMSSFPRDVARVRTQTWDE
jgi:hypothetical protein